ncbi:MAG: T9SS type A sorting domain-containing protein [Chitinophagales bacterium]
MRTEIQLSFFCFLCLWTTTIIAQNTWTGATDSNWAEASNWSSAAIPIASDDVTIPDVTNAPVIEAGTDAIAQSIIVETDAEFTISTDASLAINNSSGDAIYNLGIINNSGMLNIGNTGVIGGDGIYNRNTFNNNTGGEINIDQTIDEGIDNSNGLFTNAGDINIGNASSIGGTGLLNTKIFENTEDGEININRTTEEGIYNALDDLFTNAGKINIGNLEAIGSVGLQITAPFENKEGGEITINRTGNAGIRHAISNDFINSGKISIGNLGNIEGRGIDNTADFENTEAGVISINRTTDDAFFLAISTFVNAGKLHIGDLANTGGNGIYVTNNFENAATGEIYINRTIESGIYIPTSSFNNYGKISIGNLYPTGEYGLLVTSNFYNYSTGELHIISTINDGIFKEGYGTFLNNPCGVISIAEKINNEKTFDNKGFLYSSFEGTHINTGTFSNQGVIEDTHNAFDGITFTNANLRVIPIFNCNSNTFSNALESNNLNTFTIGTNWYSDELMTNIAGTYNQTTNIFDLNLPLGEHTLYMEVTDRMMDCSETMTIKVTGGKPDIAGSLEYCASEETTTLNAGNGNSYKWSNGETSQVIEATKGTYTVTVTNSNDCTGTNEVTVTENESPSPSINGDLEYCASDNFTTLDAGIWTSYKWSNGETTQMIEATKGTYTVTVSNSNDCTGTNEVKVIENENPSPAITGTFDYCRGRQATLDAGTWTNYQWSNGETVQGFSTTSIGVYTVTVTNEQGCTSTATAEVTAIPCLAEAGTLTTNAATICAGGNIEVNTIGEQTGTNYPQYFFLYTQDNLCITSLHESMIADYGTGKAAATFEGLEAGDYLVCAYNECQNCLPNPSPITSNLDNIYQTGTIQDGCFDIECTTMNVPEAFTHNVEESGAAPITGTEMTLFIAEVCGGTAPYSMDYDFSSGFISEQEYPSENAGCISYQVTYTQGTDWTLTITDAHNCSNENVVFTSAGLPSTPLPQITNHTTSPETCIGDEDGSITIEVEGGNTSCDEFTYTWSGFNGVNETAIGAVTGNILENIAAGMNAVTVTDWAGTTAVQTGINVTRSSGRGRGRGRGGCKTGAELEENPQLFASPNPFSNHTLIEFSLVETSKVWLSVYSIDGRKVATLLQGETMEGEAWQQVDFEANSLQNGIYILELQTETGVHFQEKLMILK